MAAAPLRPMFGKNQFNRMIARFREQTEEKIVLTLIRAGEEFVSHARKSGTYSNRSGNLRSSIGYIVVKDGQVIMLSNFQSIATNNRVIVVDFHVKKDGKRTGEVRKRNVKIKGGDGKDGSDEGRTIAVNIASSYPRGIVLIGVAGMEYGKYVEAMGYDVITGAAIHTEEYLRRSINALMNKL